MLIRVNLGDADQKRYGVSGPLDFDWTDVPLQPTVVMQAGYSVMGVEIAFDSPNHWRRALIGEPVFAEDGTPEMVDVTGTDGTPLVDPETNEPTRIQRRRPNFGAVLVMVWLALRANGVRVPLSEVDCSLDKMTWDLVPDADERNAENSGKDPSDPETT